eukprot:TRINITY_DN30191_c0_g1_i2.p1 TRINITY_DN30191_c0_g1~~TRINITY_DN30191_c0_g1_i2.p1  ORF type:complete len:274 (-),score=25.89 TRINITY_DN30191_c0_g1_i2:392-1213(-)
MSRAAAFLWYCLLTVALSFPGELDEARQLQYFAREGRKLSWRKCLMSPGLEAIVFSLKPSFEAKGRRGVLIDVGANVGNSMKQLARVFAEPVSNEYFNHDSSRPWPCNEASCPVIIYAFEPNPHSFGKLLQRSNRLRNEMSSLHAKLFQAAVSNDTGTLMLYHEGEGDRTSALHSREGEFGDRQMAEVEVVTLDGILSHRPLVHLLKIDAEGLDPLVLQGARSMLKKNLVKFILFEYSASWGHSGHGVWLRHATAELQCFVFRRPASFEACSF